ncbi:hypothetical protein [Bartonella australis]|uniref:hypothetical protein n=1 Tax=Bartonella australis TaxID=388640 RepID=UPI00034DC5FD|nr:hypothetical protein [Bartonella australis]
MEGVLININSFDQWDVELCREWVNELLLIIGGANKANNHGDLISEPSAHI